MRCILSARYSPRHGSEIDHLVRQAQFLHDHQSSPKEVICSIAKILPVNRGGGLHTILAQKLLSLFQARDESLSIHSVHLSPLNEVSIHTLLTSHQCTTQVVHATKKIQRFSPIPLDKTRKPLSKNPVWNACIRNEGLSIDLMRENVDTFEHRQGRVRKSIPWSCREYHRDSTSWWIYPDEPNTQVLLTKKGEYIAVRRSRAGTQ
jgi:hypothetical protein